MEKILTFLAMFLVAMVSHSVIPDAVKVGKSQKNKEKRFVNIDNQYPYIKLTKEKKDDE